MESIRTNILEPFSRNFTRVAKILKPALHFYGLFDENVAEFSEALDPVIDMSNALASGGLSRFDDYIVRTQPWVTQKRAWTDTYGTKYYQRKNPEAPPLPPRKKKSNRFRARESNTTSLENSRDIASEMKSNIAEPRTHVASYNPARNRRPIRQRHRRPRRASYGGGGDITWSKYRSPERFASSSGDRVQDSYSDESTQYPSDYYFSGSSMSSGIGRRMKNLNL